MTGLRPAAERKAPAGMTTPTGALDVSFSYLAK
jgi:hypothetical protein